MNIIYKDVEKSILNIKYEKRDDVIKWGIDNCQPQLIEALTDISVTSKLCVEKGAKAISGGGFNQLGDKVVNKEGQTLNKVLRLASKELELHQNFFLQIAYNLLGEFSSIKLVPSTYCRYSKSDDRDYSGKIIVYDNWDKSKKSKIYKDSYKYYDVFNPNTEVVKKQIEAAGGIEKYNGQILHVKIDTTKKYATSKLFTAKEDALTEHNSSLFRNNGSKRGFLGTKLLVTKPFENEKDKREFVNEIKSLQGAENAASIIALEAQQVSDKLESEIYVSDLTTNYNDKLFEYSDKQAERNISKAFDIPLILVSQTESGLFGNSGELLKEAKLQLWESRENERQEVEEVFTLLMSNFKGKAENLVLDIINPFETITPQEAE